jgi:hypothetical protein
VLNVIILGGDFSDELLQAGITGHHLFPVSDMVPSVVSDKNVLYISAAEIVKNRAKSIAAASALESRK